eukprot:3672556-Lingulodinium_polyedra.AAC.1
MMTFEQPCSISVPLAIQKGRHNHLFLFPKGAPTPSGVGAPRGRAPGVSSSVSHTAQNSRLAGAVGWAG